MILVILTLVWLRLAVFIHFKTYLNFAFDDDGSERSRFIFCAECQLLAIEFVGVLNGLQSPVFLTTNISAEYVPANHAGTFECCGRYFAKEGTVVIRKPSEMLETIVKRSIGDSMAFAAM